MKPLFLSCALIFAIANSVLAGARLNDQVDVGGLWRFNYRGSLLSQPYTAPLGYEGSACGTIGRHHGHSYVAGNDGFWYKVYHPANSYVVAYDRNVTLRFFDRSQVDSDGYVTLMYEEVDIFKRKSLVENTKTANGNDGVTRETGQRTATVQEHEPHMILTPFRTKALDVFNGVPHDVPSGYDDTPGTQFDFEGTRYIVGTDGFMYKL